MTEQDQARAMERFWMALTKLAEKHGATPMNKHEGCWEHQVDEHWRICVNGHREPRKAGGVEVPPFHAYVEFNGWPAGLLSPAGGTVAAGEAANIVTLADAVEAAL